MSKTTIAIDLGGTHIRAARVTDGTVNAYRKVCCHAHGSETEVLEQLCALIDELITDDVERIGVGVPSVVDYDKGIVYHVQNIPSWKEVHLKDYLEGHYHIPAVVDNDVNCFVLGEKFFGAGSNFRNIVGVTLGTGIGAGIVCNGEVYRGTNTGAGEIGCLSYLDADYEQYCSSQWMKRHGLDASVLSKKAAEGDEDALAMWEEFGHHLGKFMQVILFAYDPDAIIIGGGIAGGAKFFWDAMLQSMHEGFPYLHEANNVKITISQLENCNLLGASIL